MKLIQQVQIWDNGVTKEASILDAYAVNVSLNQDATFYYGLYEKMADDSLGQKLKDGNVFMPNAEYDQWQTDDYAWSFVASSLNLTIIGNYVPPVIIVDEPIVEESLPESPSNSL